MLVEKEVGLQFRNGNFILPQMVEESVEILFHLNGIILGLGHTEYPKFAIFPCAVLFQQKGQKHQKATVMHDPPNVNVASDFVTGVRVPLDPLGHQQCHLGRCRVADGVDKHSPGLAFLLSPPIRPTQNNGIRFHATQACALNTVNKRRLMRRYFRMSVIQEEEICDGNLESLYEQGQRSEAFKNMRAEIGDFASSRPGN